MDFNELRRICETNHIATAKVAEEIGLSYEGLKKGIRNGSLAIRYVIPLCDLLCISPDFFFGVKEKKGNSQTQNGGIGNTQFMDAGAVSILQDQLKKKDDQISMLIQLLNK